ncbi:MAG TPA: hypothetical protein ENO14_05725 [Chromatiales bacterium]|nr:hypothetical protein [Chromatiales bacterium]
MGAVFKEELALLSPDALPLQQGMAHGNVAVGESLSAMIIATELTEDSCRIHAGLFFGSLIAGCACHNDPTPMTEQSEYCEVMFDIERPGGDARVRVID